MRGFTIDQRERRIWEELGSREMGSGFARHAPSAESRRSVITAAQTRQREKGLQIRFDTLVGDSQLDAGAPFHKRLCRFSILYKPLSSC